MNKPDLESNIPQRLGKRIWRGVTLQLFLVAVLPLTVLVLVITFGSIKLHQEAMRSLVSDRNLRAVQSAADSISREIDHRGSTLEIISKTVEAGGEVEEALIQVEENLAVFDGGMAVISRNGDPTAFIGNRAIRQFAASPDWFKILNAIKTSIPGNVEYLSIQTVEGQFYTPVIISGSSGVSLIGLFSPEKLLFDGLSIILREENVNVLVIDKNYKVLYQNGKENSGEDFSTYNEIQRALEGNGGNNYLKTASGELIITTATIQPVGWVLVNEEAWEDIASPLLRATQNAPLIFIPILGLSIIALWFGLRQIVQPMQALESKTVDMGGGNFETIKQPVGGVLEIQHLQKTLIDMAEKLKEAQDSLHSYIGAITDSVENERRNLARELHDETLQSLIALGQYTQYALHWNKNPKVETTLNQITNMTDQGVKNLRRLIQGLRPIYIEDLGLVTALAMQSTDNKRPDGLKIHFQLEGIERRLKSEIEMAMYRISQEAINNVIQHANAKNAWITLSFHKKSIILEIRDDGQGFNIPLEPMDYARKGHYGLLGIYERSELIGAKLIIRSVLKEGTRIVVQLNDSDLKE
ncbi:MAG: histidine kinase [Bacillota bacterium]